MRRERLEAASLGLLLALVAYGAPIGLVLVAYRVLA